MRSLALLCCSILAVAATSCHTIRAAERYAKESPFEEVRMAGAEAEVLLEGAWYRLVSIDGIPTATILEYSRKEYSDKWEKRFAEDLVEVLTGMGHAPGKIVDLELRQSDGRVVTRPDVAMTEEKRSLVLRARQREPPLQRVSRRHASTSDPALAPLVSRIDRTIPAHAVADDLDELEWVLDNRHSYATLRGVDYRASLDAIRLASADGITENAFAIQLARALAPLGDAHSRVDGVRSSRLPWGSLPVRFVEVDGQVAALGPSGKLVSAPHPFLVSIDGRPVDEWLRAAAPMVPASSPRFVRRRSIDLLPRVAAWRAAMGLPPAQSATLALRGPEGATRELSLDLVSKPPEPRAKPSGHRVLDDGLGYLRIAEMSDDPEVTKAIDVALEDLEKTPGLILDVRGNPGGSRLLTLVIAGDLLGRRHGLRVGNVAALRRPASDGPESPEGHLSNRFAFPLTSTRWSAEDKAALAEFAKTFEPEWKPPRGQFTEWHYFAVKGRNDEPRHPGPVAILMDGGCFSATDIFLGTMKGLPGVTLVGTASGGGSGRVEGYELERSGIGVSLSTMVSLGPDGKLYEGEGIQPDVVVEPTLSDVQGLTDSQLDAARRLLLGRRTAGSAG